MLHMKENLPVRAPLLLMSFMFLLSEFCLPFNPVNLVNPV